MEKRKAHKGKEGKTHVILRRNLLPEHISNHRNVLHDVLAHLGHIREEKESEQAGDGAEGARRCATNELYVRLPIIFLLRLPPSSSFASS